MRHPAPGAWHPVEGLIHAGAGVCRSQKAQKQTPPLKRYARPWVKSTQPRLFVGIEHVRCERKRQCTRVRYEEINTAPGARD